MSALLNSPSNTKSDAKRILLLERLRNAAKATIPLSFAQQRLWFLDQVEPNSPLYSVPTVAKMRGVLDVKALGQALSQIVTRHESLRTRFVDIDGNPAQIVDSDLSLGFEFCDLSGGTSSS